MFTITPRSIMNHTELVSFKENHPHFVLTNGAEAFYYQISETQGVKVFVKSHELGRADGTYGHTTVESLLESNFWREILRQAHLMQKLSAAKRAPILFEMFIVENSRGQFYPALRMEHLTWSAPCNLPEGSLKNYRYKRRNRFLKSIDRYYYNTDDHEGNIVFCEKDRRFKIIDFGGIVEKYPSKSKAPKELQASNSAVTLPLTMTAKNSDFGFFEKFINKFRKGA